MLCREKTSFISASSPRFVTSVEESSRRPVRARQQQSASQAESVWGGCAATLLLAKLLQAGGEEPARGRAGGLTASPETPQQRLPAGVLSPLTPLRSGCLGGGSLQRLEVRGVDRVTRRSLVNEVV